MRLGVGRASRWGRWTSGHLLSDPGAEPLSMVHFGESAELCEAATVSGRRAGRRRRVKIVELNSPLKSPFVGTAVASDTSLQCVRTHCSSLARQGKKATPLNAHVCERSRVPMSDTQHPWELREQIFACETLTRVSRLTRLRLSWTPTFTEWSDRQNQSHYRKNYLPKGVNLNQTFMMQL